MFLPNESVIEVFYNNYGVGIIPSKPISKNKYLISLILPFLVLGIVPTLTWAVTPITNITFHSIFCICAFANLSFCIVDLYSVFDSIFNIPKGSTIYFSGTKNYYY